jgi:hypothetical protein
MKDNEIGHFPWLPPQNQFDKGGYPRQYIAHDEKGKCIIENGHTKWATNWKILGEVDLIDIPKGKEYDELLVDLQTAQECYCADLLVVDGVRYVALKGSGWADEGFPFYDDTITEKDLYATGSGCYALIRGKAAEEFIKLAKKDCIPSFKAVFTGDYRQDFVLPKE